MTAKYAKSNDGLIHLLSALNCEYTVCGNAFEGDGYDLKNDPNAHTPCKKGPVTCGNCITEIKNGHQAWKVLKKVRCNRWKECPNKRCPHRQPHDPDCVCGEGHCNMVNKNVKCIPVKAKEAREDLGGGNGRYKRLS